MDVEIQEDEGLKARVLDTCRRWLSRDNRDAEIHVSDVIDPRQAVLRRLYGSRLGEREVTLFISGRSYHEIVEALVADNLLHREVEVRWGGVVGHIDATPDGVPFEFKSSRSWKPAPVTDLSKRYIRNLGYYVALHNPDRELGVGKLGVLYVAAKDKLTGGPPLKLYTITYNDLGGIRSDVLCRREAIEAVLDGRKPFAELPDCDQNEFKDWSMCGTCLFSAECSRHSAGEVIAWKRPNGQT